MEIEEETGGHLPACNRLAEAEALFKERTVSPACESGVKGGTDLLGKHPAG
jgi:hypothetical protein